MRLSHNVTQSHAAEFSFCFSLPAFTLPWIQQVTVCVFLQSWSILRIGTWSGEDAAKIIYLDWPGWKLSFIMSVIAPPQMAYRLLQQSSGLCVCHRVWTTVILSSRGGGVNKISQLKEGSGRHVGFTKSTSAFFSLTQCHSLRKPIPQRLKASAFKNIPHTLL